MGIRPAHPDEHVLLTALARRSKAHWGYSEAFMAACEDELTVTRSRIEQETYLVAVDQDAVVGMAAIASCDGGFEVSNMFVDPTMIGTGVGRRLFQALTEEARRQGIAELLIDADPNACLFYERLGARFSHMTPSGSIPGREIPHLRLTL